MEILMTGGFAGISEWSVVSCEYWVINRQFEKIFNVQYSILNVIWKIE